MIQMNIMVNHGQWPTIMVTKGFTIMPAESQVKGFYHLDVLNLLQ